MGLGSSSQENLLNLIDRQGRRLRQELMAGAITLAGLFVIGTAWYRYEEDWTWLDAFYMFFNFFLLFASLKSLK